MYHFSFYLIAGFGHIKPAEALVEQFQRKGVPGQAWNILSPDGTPSSSSASLYNAITRSPLLNPIYNLITRHDLLPYQVFIPTHWLESFFYRSLIPQIAQLVASHPQSIATATHWLPALLAAQALPKQKIFLYVTDIHPHGLWYLSQPNIHYLVPMEETKIDLTRYGIDPHRITICSFPIHQEILDRQKQRLHHRLYVLKKKNPRNIDVLVISGGAGTGKQEMKRLIDSFSLPAKAKQIRLTFLVSTPTLEQELIHHCQKRLIGPEQYAIYPYTPHSLYQALQKTEILVTKAGGDITFEALAEGLPIYTLKDVGDHERLNRQYLELIGASKPLFQTRQPWDLIQSDILTEEIILMTQAANKNGLPHRRATTTDCILNLLE